MSLISFLSLDTLDGTYDVLHIDFNRSFIENVQKERLVTFYTRTSDKKYLSDIKFLNFSSSGLASNRLKTSIRVLQRQFGKCLVKKDKMSRTVLLTYFF